MAHERILIVEDETAVAHLVEGYLAQEGYFVVGIAETGERGIEDASKLRADLALMDIHLGGELDGIQAAEQLQTQFDIPVVFLTGLPDPPTLQRSREAQAFGYLLKPFRPDELKASIQLALDKHRLGNKLKAERHQSEQALRGSEERYRSLFELCPDAV